MMPSYAAWSAYINERFPRRQETAIENAIKALEAALTECMDLHTCDKIIIPAIAGLKAIQKPK